MPRKTTILIVILAVVTAILVILAVTSEQTKKYIPTPKASPTPSKTAVVPTTILSFDPSTINVVSSSVPPADIIADTGAEGITGVQVELLYDPKVLTNVKIIPPADQSLFGTGGTGYTVLFNEVKPELGRISYAIAINQTQKPAQGIGKIGTLSFQKVFGAAVSTDTFVRFVDKTMVTKLGESQNVLKQANPLTVTFQATAEPTGGTTIQNTTGTPIR